MKVGICVDQSRLAIIGGLVCIGIAVLIFFFAAAYWRTVLDIAAFLFLCWGLREIIASGVAKGIKGAREPEPKKEAEKPQILC